DRIGSTGSAAAVGRTNLPARRAGERRTALLGLNWVLCRFPGFPPTLQRVYVLVTVSHELECHTGTGPFVRSGAIEDECLVLRIFGHPRSYCGRVFPDRPLYLRRCVRPVVGLPDVYDREVGVIHLLLQLLDAHPRNTVRSDHSLSMKGHD